MCVELEQIQAKEEKQSPCHQNRETAVDIKQKNQLKLLKERRARFVCLKWMVIEQTRLTSKSKQNCCKVEC